jgi:hypothetical protein
VSEAKDMVPIAVAASEVRTAEPRRAFDRMIQRLERRYSRTLVGAAQWNQPDHVIDKLPPDMARAAYAARCNKKEAPMGLHMAQEYLTVKARMDAIKNSKGALSISIAGNAVIQLPTRLPQPEEQDVVVIEADGQRDDDS